MDLVLISAMRTIHRDFVSPYSLIYRNYFQHFTTDRYGIEFEYTFERYQFVEYFIAQIESIKIVDVLIS